MDVNNIFTHSTFTIRNHMERFFITTKRYFYPLTKPYIWVFSLAVAAILTIIDILGLVL